MRTSPPPRIRGIDSAWMSVGSLEKSKLYVYSNLSKVSDCTMHDLATLDINLQPVHLLHSLGDFGHNAHLCEAEGTFNDSVRMCSFFKVTGC